MAATPAGLGFYSVRDLVVIYQLMGLSSDGLGIKSQGPGFPDGYIAYSVVL